MKDKGKLRKAWWYGWILKCNMAKKQVKTLFCHFSSEDGISNVQIF